MSKLTISNTSDKTDEFFKELEENKIRQFFVPSIKAQKKTVKKTYDEAIKQLASSIKETITSLYHKLDTSESIMGTFAKRIKQVVGENKDKYDEIVPGK